MLHCADSQVDYGLSPASQFPEAVLQCYAVYRWLRLHALEAINLHVRKIILTGDSAGGNLVFAVVCLLTTISSCSREVLQSVHRRTAGSRWHIRRLSRVESGANHAVITLTCHVLSRRARAGALPLSLPRLLPDACKHSSSTLIDA